MFVTAVYSAITSLEIWLNGVIFHKTCFHVSSVSFYLEFEKPPFFELLVKLDKELILNLIVFALVEGFEDFIGIDIL